MEGWNDGGRTELLLPAKLAGVPSQAKNDLLAKSGPRPIAAPSATPPFGGPVAPAELVCGVKIPTLSPVTFPSLTGDGVVLLQSVNFSLQGWTP